MPNPPHFFSCDWGTTSLRLRLIEAAGEKVLGELEDTKCGVREVAGTLPKHASLVERATAFERVLAHKISVLPGSAPAVEAQAPVVVSGMASSSIGWKELPYAKIPFAADGSTACCQWIEARISEHKLAVLLVSGLASGTEMMRGEETQLIGLLAQTAFSECSKDGLVVLPGTHSKHVRVREGSAIGLQTYMTGELFDVLCRHSVLRFTTGTDAPEWDQKEFVEGVETARSTGLMRSLFQVRTRGVLHGKSAPANRAFLSGLLLGAELCRLLEEKPIPQLLIAAPDTLLRAYNAAAEHLRLVSHLYWAGSEQLRRSVITAHAMLLKRNS